MLALRLVGTQETLARGVDPEAMKQMQEMIANLEVAKQQVCDAVLHD